MAALLLRAALGTARWAAVRTFTLIVVLGSFGLSQTDRVNGQNIDRNLGQASGQNLGEQLDRSRTGRGPQRAAVRWENVSSRHQHIAGAEPRFVRRQKLHIIELAPGQSTDFQVRPHEYVRAVVLNQGDVNIDQLEFWTSNGTGLFRRLIPSISTDGKSIVAAPHQSGISIARITNRSSSGESFAISAFTSVRDARRPLDYYQCLVACDEKTVEIKDDLGRKPRHYYPLKSGRRYPLHVDGNSRLRLESRLKYGLDASEHQQYWLKIYIDGLYHQTIPFDTYPTSGRRHFSDGKEQLIGGREFVYLDLEPESESVEIELSHAVYFRADAVGLNLVDPLTRHRFNFATDEQRLVDEDSWLELALEDDERTLDEYLQGETTVSPAVQEDPRWNPYLSYSNILAVARNNRIPFGGLRAYMWMRAIASKRRGESDFGDEVSVPELVDRLGRRHTFFTDLPPVDLNETSNPRRVGFFAPKIRRPNQPATETVIGEQHVLEQSEKLLTTTLYQLSTNGDVATGTELLQFHPQQNAGASVLRIIVDRQRLTADANLQIQYDDRPPIELKLAATDGLAQSAFVPSRPQTALTALAHLHDRYGSGSWGGPFATIDRVVPTIEAGTAEFILPANVGNVTVLATSTSDPSVSVGVQMLTSGSTKLSESAFRKHLKQVHAPTAIHDFSLTQLDNDAVGLSQLIENHYQRARANVFPNFQTQPASQTWPDPQLESQQALTLAQAGNQDWVSAIESLTELIHHSHGAVRREAILGRIQVLDHAGETFFANVERRGWLFYSDDAELKRQLLDSLLEKAAGTPGEGLSRERWLAVAVREIGDLNSKIEFAQQLAANRKYRYAMLALPPEANGPDVEELKLRCCFQLRWWRTYNDTLKQTKSLDRRNFWGGMKALRLGKYRRSFRLLRAAGQRGQNWLAHWKYGDSIYTRLTDDDLLTRMSAIEDWESWLEKHPGKRTWQPAPGAINRSHGHVVAVSPATNVRIKYHFVQRDRPATLQLHGPIKLKIECRPIHAESSTDPIDGVLEISSGDHLQRLPILNNLPASSLELEGRQGFQKPGQRELVEIDLPAGFHEIELNCRQANLLLRASTLEPEMRSPVLPPINSTTLAAVVAGRFGNASKPKTQVRSKHQVEIDTVRLVARDTRGHSQELDFIPLDGRDLDLTLIRQDLVDQLGDIPTWMNRIKPAYPTFTLIGQDTVYQSAVTNHFSEPTDLPSEIDRITLGQDEANRLQKIVDLQVLALQHPDNQPLQRLLKHAKRGTTWQRIQQFDRRAGIYFENVQQWKPNSSGMRIRKSLQGVQTTDHAIVGDRPLVLDLNQLDCDEVEITLARPRVSFTPMTETPVFWEFRGQQHQITIDADGNPQHFRIQLNEGGREFERDQTRRPSHDYERQVSLWMPVSFSNHIIHVDVDEVLTGDLIDPAFAGNRQSGQSKRAYHVATQTEPFQFRVAGPTVIRVERLMDGHLTLQEIPVSEPSRTFEFFPDDGVQSANYRIFQLTIDDKPHPQLPPPQSQPPVVQAGHWVDQTVDHIFDQVDQNFEVNDFDLLPLRAPDAPSVNVAIEDAIALGSEDVGTVGLHFGYRERRALDEFPIVQTPGRFFELALSNRKFDPWENIYKQTELLIRPRLATGPTFGFRHGQTRAVRTINGRSDRSAAGWADAIVRWNVFGFGQIAGTPQIDDANAFPWTIGFNGRLSRKQQITHTISRNPAIALFGQFLSEDINGFGPGQLDQDIFTNFKSNHRFGFRLSDRWVYQKRLDRRFYLEPQLNSNEDQLIPDSGGFEVGGNQLFGPVEVGIGYRFRGFLSDNDRVETGVQNLAIFNLKTEHWHSHGRRTQFAFSVRYNAGQGATVGLFLNHYFSGLRGYQDFAPGDVLFRSLKEEHSIRLNHGFPN